MQVLTYLNDSLKFEKYIMNKNYKVQDYVEMVLELE